MTRVIGVWDRDNCWFKQNAWFGHHALLIHHICSRHALSLSLFYALHELEPQHFDDSVAVKIVLSASGLVSEDVVRCCFCLFFVWSVVAVAVLWHFVVPVVPSIRSVLLSLLWAAVVQSDLVVLVVVPCAFLESGPSARSLIIMSRI